jgi:hypothetical protein
VVCQESGKRRAANSGRRILVGTWLLCGVLPTRERGAYVLALREARDFLLRTFFW